MSILTATTTTVGSDARQRSVRTLVVGFVATVVAAVLTVVIPAIQSGVDKVDWSKLGASVATVALVTAGTYIMGKVLPALNAPILEDPAPEVEAPVADPAVPAVPAIPAPPVDGPTFSV